MPIRCLPPLLVNQIAAGEVIERPASVVKELIENSIDGGAARIEVEIEDGGRELIRVRDDGRGIAPAELHLAVAPHATSKIEKQEDLDAIATMGFRGEALASIASVSRLSILSRTLDETGGAILEAEGETIGTVKPHASPVGTTVTVRNLFFNTPARRKFLKTAVTEASRIADMIEAVALAHPHVAFSLQSNTRKTVDLPAEQTPRRRVVEVVGRELEEQLLEVSVDETADRGLSIWGLIGLPGIARGNANHQRLYLNGRPIRDKSLMHALKEAYRGLIEPGRYPTLVLFIEIDPRQVDVNVHPTKAEVRFRNQTMVHGTVLRAVRDRLRDADLTPTFDLARRQSGAVNWKDSFVASHQGSFGSGLSSPPSPPNPTTARDFVSYFRRLDPKQKGFVYSEVKEALERETPDVMKEVEEVISTHQPDAHDLSASSIPMPQRVLDILQVHSSYIVTQDESGIVIIDQHALHERVMFEQLKSRLERGDLESQRLLMPAVLEVDRLQVERLHELKPLLDRIGIDAEPMGPGSIAVHAFPSFLFERHVEIEPFIKELLERSMQDADDSSDSEAALAEVLDMMACKAAIKAGDRLSSDELAELLKYRESVERASNCPHGRPTTLRLSIEDLNRQFGRT